LGEVEGEVGVQGWGELVRADKAAQEKVVLGVREEEEVGYHELEVEAVGCNQFEYHST
jgi:hypothetical protein